MESLTKAEVKIGNWYTYCCQKDLAQIETQEDIDNINDLIADDFGVDIYETQLEALQDIRESWVRSLALNGGSDPENYQSEIDDCDEMLRGLTKRAVDGATRVDVNRTIISGRYDKTPRN